MTAEDKTARQLEKALDYLRAYKARQDRIVLGLGDIRKALDAGQPEVAGALLTALLDSDLKQARQRVMEREQALSIAVEAIAECRCMRFKTIDALPQIKALVPEAFGEPAAAPGASA